MFFTQDRVRLRNFYRETYNKALRGESLEPLEELVADVIREHPEYHRLFDGSDDALDADFAPEDGAINPWLHLSLHVALREQVGTDRPNGIADITRSLLLKHQDGHEVEHLMFECLGTALWNAQQSGQLDQIDSSYLECLKHLVKQ
ncbi:MAG: DUF1841 family protein [Pseudomonadota bacterium]